MNARITLPALALLGAITALAAVILWPDPPAEEGNGVGMGGDYRFPVTATPVTFESVIESVELVGDVVSARRSTLAFDRTGTLAAVHVRLGDRVEEGQLLAELDDRVLEQEVASARAAAEVAAEEAAFASSEARRAREVGDDIVSESERDRLLSASAVAAKLLKQRQAEVARLEAALAQGRLHAPFAGAIARRMLDEGAQAGPNAPVFDLVDPDHREVRLEVPAPLVASLGVGSPVRLTLDEQPDWQMDAALDSLVPAADPGSRSFTAVIRLDGKAAADARSADPAAALLPGVFVRARLTLAEVEGRPVVPVDALVETEDGGVVVYQVQPPQPDASGSPPGPGAPPTAALVPVRLLARGPERVAVQPLIPDMLGEGSQVVLTGVQNVYPGANLGVQASREDGADDPGGDGPPEGR